VEPVDVLRRIEPGNDPFRVETTREWELNEDPVDIVIVVQPPDQLLEVSLRHVCRKLMMD
jgi:hypothetical protein